MVKQKYSDEFKLKIVEEYNQNLLGYKALSKIHKVLSSEIRRWVGLYKEHGKEGLLTVNRNKNYDGDFKVRTIEYMLENHSSIKQTAIHFRVSNNSISSWLKMYKAEGKESLFKQNRGNQKLKMRKPKKIKDKKTTRKEETIETIEEKIERLEIENAYLKKENEYIKKKFQIK